MTNFDMTPLYRSTIGYDRLANLFDALGAPEKTAAYPPYDVARTGETDYRISMAVAGFAESELDGHQRAGGRAVAAGAGNREAAGRAQGERPRPGGGDACGSSVQLPNNRAGNSTR